MRLIKYDGISDKSVKAILGSSGGNSSSNSSDVGSRSEYTELNRTIWGQDDTGDDIDGSMTVNGNISIKCIIPPSYEDDDSDDGEDEVTEEGGGNLDVELKITSKDVEANNIYATEHLYIPHPTTKAKTDIVELLKGYDSRITNNTTNIASNKTEIDALKDRVDTAETNITNLNTTVNNHTTNIQKNADDIADLQDKVANGVSEDYIKQLIEQLAISRNGSYSNPIILISGRFRRSSVSGSNFYFFDGQNNNNMYVNTATAENGLLTIKLTSYNNAKIYISSVVVTQYKSGDTTDEITNPYIKGRSDGAHWFEARCDSHSDTKEIYIREFHQGNGDNDTWYSDNWFGDGGIKQINVIATGYIIIPNNE